MISLSSILYLIGVAVPVVVDAAAFMPATSYGRKLTATLQSSNSRRQTIPYYLIRNLAKKDDEDRMDNNPGMEDAFRQLDALDSLGDTLANVSPSSSSGRKSTIDTSEMTIPTDTNAVAPEQEMELYKELAKDLEKDDTELYSDVLSEMGGTPAPAPAPAVEPPKVAEPEKTSETTTTTPTTSISSQDTEQFMNQALDEALKEAKSKTPEELSSLSDNILNDQEIMKEIEEIFDKGNEKLLASLEEIRIEQKNLAEEQAQKRSLKRDEMSSEDAERLAQAESAMSAMLDKVNKETLEVEKAVEELKRAQEQIGDDPLMNLKQGGIIKQGALVGALLFFLRAGGDLTQLYGIDGEAHMTAAVIQGGIALACAAIYFLF